MGRLTERLSPGQLIGLDTSIFIYHLEAHPSYSPITREIFTGIETGQWSAATSVITLMELTVHPWKMDRQDVARKYEALLVHFPNLSLIEIDRDIARKAAQLRARYNIRPADALQAATCLVRSASPFITNDSRLSRLAPVLDVRLLGDFVRRE
jgi:predicted nucleic acid-binding protein